MRAWPVVVGLYLVGCSRAETSNAVNAPPVDDAGASMTSPETIVSPAPLHEVIDAQWTKLARAERGMFYLQARSPTYPATWPFTAGAPHEFRTYGYAFGQEPGKAPIADGTHVASAWIVLTGPIGGPYRVQRAPMHDLGIQGMEPVMPGTVPTDDERIAAAKELDGMPGAPSPLVQKVYCSFLRYNGVFAGSIAGDNVAFTKWLACPGR